MPATETKSKDFVMSRVFDAPRALLWQCFTDPERMKHWWGPKGFTVLSSKMDLRVGGIYRYGMKAPDGAAMWGLFKYREIVPQEKLVFVNSFSDEKGGITRHPGSASWPLYLLSTFTFEDAPGGKTKFTVTWRTLDAADEEQKTFDAMHASMTQGWGGTMDQLAAYLAKAGTYGEATVAITRMFDAPRALVWQAWTDPKMLGQWFGPRGFTSSVPAWDLRVGGALRIVMHGPDGNDYPMKGVFTEVKASERLVFSNIPIDKDGNHLMEGETVVTFSERDGKTELVVKSHMVGLVPIALQMLAGMEAGWTQSIDKLDELLA